MKHSTKITLAFTILLSTTTLFSSDSPRCDKKIKNIQEKIKIAKSENLKHKVNGLETSLSKVQKYCSDSDLIQDIKDKIEDTQKDLSEHTDDYNKALKDNRTKKMEKYQSKIDEDNAKITELLQELNGN